MTNVVKGNATLYLSQEDPSGNVGYSLKFKYSYEDENPVDSMTYSNIEFSGPGSWEDYSEGDVYPYSQMFEAALSHN